MNKVNINVEEMDYTTEEELKTLRTNLLFCGVDKKVIVVTSTIPGEGKTETSMNLARSLAKLNKKVLLIDLDLRKSVMITRYEMENVKYGMSHFSVGTVSACGCDLCNECSKLHVAIAGPATPNPTELLSGERFHKMIESLERCL